MVYFYAQLNENNICVGVSSLGGEINQENMIKISSMNDDLFFRKYDYETQTWSEEKYLPDYGQVELDRMEAVEKAILELSMLIGGM